MRYIVKTESQVEIEAETPEEAAREITAAQEVYEPLYGAPIELANILLVNSKIISVTTKHELQ